MEKTIEYFGEEICVNSDGTIIWNGKTRNHYYNKDGYPTISIGTKNGYRSITVHRLIAVAFIPNPNNLPEVDHINYDRTDFSISNLRWVTRQENIDHSLINLPKRYGKDNPNYGNHKLSQFYKEHPEEAKAKQGRPGKQNGRYKHGKYMQQTTAK